MFDMYNIPLITNKIKKIKETKKMAQEKNISNSWYQGLIYSITGLFFIGTMISLPIAVGLDVVITEMNWQGTIIEEEIIKVMNVGVFLIPIAFVFRFIENGIKLYLVIMEKTNKAIFNGWQKLDMWYFKKYRKQSPLTDSYSKINDKANRWSSKLSKNQKKLIKITLIVLLISINIYWKAPMIEELLDTNQEEIIPEVESDNQIKPEAPEIIVNINKGG